MNQGMKLKIKSKFAEVSNQEGKSKRQDRISNGKLDHQAEARWYLMTGRYKSQALEFGCHWRRA